MRIDSEYLESIAKEKYKKYCDIHEGKVIISKEVFLEHEAIVTRVIRLALSGLCGNLYNFERVHIYDVIDIQKNSTGKQLNLPNNVLVSNTYGDVIIGTNREENLKVDEGEFTLQLGVNKPKNLKLRIHMKLINNVEEGIEFKRKKLLKYFDYDKIKGDITLRYRKDGDRFRPLGMSGSKKLKDLFIDLKIPKDKRDRIPLICFNEDIGWIVGYRESELFKVDKDTKTVLEVSIESEDM
jgi:tRNA(Ile)-lysidine synthase